MCNAGREHPKGSNLYVDGRKSLHKVNLIRCTGQWNANCDFEPVLWDKWNDKSGKKLGFKACSVKDCSLTEKEHLFGIHWLCSSNKRQPTHYYTRNYTATARNVDLNKKKDAKHAAFRKKFLVIHNFPPGSWPWWIKEGSYIPGNNTVFGPVP